MNSLSQCRLSQCRPRGGGAAAAVAVTAAALLATACSSGPSTAAQSGGAPGTAAAAGYSAAVAYSRCVRAHGIPGFPDPDSSGDIPKQAILQLKVSSSLLSAATGACEHLNPHQPASQTQQQEQLTDDLKFAQCMRSHGLPGFPDPTNSDGHVEFVISVSKDGFDPHSSQVLAKARQCQRSTLSAGSALPSVTVTS